MFFSGVSVDQTAAKLSVNMEHARNTTSKRRPYCSTAVECLNRKPLGKPSKIRRWCITALFLWGFWAVNPTNAQHEELLEILKDRSELTYFTVSASLGQLDSFLLFILDINMLYPLHVWRWFNSLFLLKGPVQMQKQINFAPEIARSHGFMLWYEWWHDFKANMWYFSLGLRVEHSVCDCQGYMVRHCCLLMLQHSLWLCNKRRA